ncbi:MAG: catalase/peroxidase HPI [Pseudomonadota bacterium]|nr:catalase/peroxidase HPI [Sphingobium sp.]MCC4251980.1 catalase/peroxidase HPI [Sphingobium naphthae]MEC8035714.1 catalase/peroxidase HPI [Pseudomonadota bacterium]PDH69410.1 MAG: catalase/peroxidase HPI [Sphingomonadaceae bacterium MED-G03]
MRRTSTSILALLVAAAMTPAFAQEHAPKKTQATEAETVSENPQPPVKEKPGGMTNKDWWPSRLDLTALRQHESMSNPYGADYDYVKEFNSLDLEAVKADIRKALTTSQPWWPADYGHYGPFFIRMAWHSAGTYRVGDGRGGSDGGEQRFDPLNSWPDNVSLDKARRLVWPIKQKYGRKLSWGDLMVLSGNVALEDMGFKTVGFAGGRIDAWQPDVVFWGPETKMMGTDRSNPDGTLKRSLAATTMGLIYVNPEGPGGNHDPIGAAADIRRAFGNMAMDDEETLALIAGGHTFGKAHGAKKPDACLGAEPTAATLEEQGLGWHNKCGKGMAEDTLTSGLEGAWSASPTQFTTQYIDNLLNFDWVKTKSPAGATQWIPTDPNAAQLVPDAHLKDKRHAPIMFTTDIALKEDPGFRKVLESWQKNPELFSKAFARAWFKLTHRDLGPQARYLGKDIPSETYSWQDPLPEPSFAAIGEADQAKLKAAVLSSGLTTPELVRAAWASASTFRSTDMRGGANGARLRLDPQRGWAVNDPAELAKVLTKLTAIQADFAKSGKQVSMADLIVLAGNAAIEQAAQRGGHRISLPFTPGRVDAAQAQTDVASFAYLEPKADGFRNYYTAKAEVGPAEALVDKADALELTVPEMTVLVGGMRALGATSGATKAGVLTTRPGTLSNDFFVNLLTMDTVWSKAATPGLYDGKDRKTGAAKWTATPVDLVFGSNSELRAVAEVYASDDAKQKFVDDFAAAWTKVMNADRF